MSIVGAGLLFPALAAAAVDMHGSWQLRANNGVTDLVDVTQAGDTVSFAYRGFTVSGTVLADGHLQATGGSPSDGLLLDGDVSADGALMNAGAVRFSTSPVLITTWILLGRRCGCVDGNATDGDGCDAECQVEPCWTCAGAPSVCVPAGDGAACEAGACTTGAACTAGVCGGGTPVSPCFDLSGMWAVHAVKTLFDTTVVDFTRSVRQHGTDILVTDSPSDRYYGTIDPNTGAFGWRRIGGFATPGLCGSDFQAIRMPFTGTVSGYSFTTTGTEAAFVSRCPLGIAVTETGMKPCIDGEPCSSGNACVTGETCVDGFCVGGTPVQCAACERCAPTTGCVAAPRPACTAPDQPARLAIHDGSDDARDRITWKWRAAAPLGPFGNPLASDGFAFCVFDTTPAVPALIFRADVPAGAQCGTRPCWKAASSAARFTYVDKAAAHDGTRMLQMQSSVARGARLSYSGKGIALSNRPDGLPSLPLSSSLTVQIQADAGACVGATYDASDIERNDPVSGAFRAESH